MFGCAGAVGFQRSDMIGNVFFLIGNFPIPHISFSPFQILDLVGSPHLWTMAQISVILGFLIFISF